VDETNGGAGDDAIKGILGTSGTYGVGDNINGGSGSDTLNLISNGSGIAGGLVSIESVETINVRLLSSAGEAVTLDATDWNGVETVTNASSLASTVLTVNGLAVTTDVKLVGQTTVNVGFNNTTTASAAVNVILSDAGSGTTSTGYATLNVDATPAGLISAVAVDLQGTTNAAYLEGGAAVKTYTITGSGKGYLNTNDTITSFNAAAATGNLDVTFSAASEVVAVGGAGNDTFRFGTNYSSDDSFNGGLGNDTITLTVQGSTRYLKTTNVESATVTFTQDGGGELNASASTVQNYTLVAGTSNAVSLTQLADAAVLTLNDDSITNLSIDYASGAATTTLNVGSASGAVDIGTLTVADVAAVAINSVGSGATIGATNFDSDLRTLTVGVSGGEADLSLDAVDLGGATTVTVNSTGSASVWFGSAISANNLGTITVNAAGSEVADITFGSATFSGTGVSLITLNATDGADILVGALSLGNLATATSKDVTISVDVNAASSDVTVGDINFTGMGTLTIDLGQAATGDISIGNIRGEITASGNPVNVTLNAVSVIGGATAGIASISMVTAGTGAQVTIGAITVAANGYFSAGTIDATDKVNIDVSDISITLGASADSLIGAIKTTAGEVGDIVLSLGANASATFSTIAASAMGSISITLAATGAVDVGAISAAQTIGGINLSASVTGSDVTFSTIGASAVGAISVAGAGSLTIGKITATSVGDITSTQGASGSFVIDLSGVTNKVNVSLGNGANNVTTSRGADSITLTRGTTGNDVITFATALGADRIVNFGAGAAATAGGADVIALSIGASGTSLTFANGSGDVMGTADAANLSVVITGATTLAAGDNIIVLGSAIASAGAVSAWLATNVALSSSNAVTGSMVVVWTDGNGDTTVSLVGHTALSTANFKSGGLISITDLAVLEGVTPGALVAANFDFVN
jgi:hypothetical protein